MGQGERRGPVRAGAVKEERKCKKRSENEKKKKSTPLCGASTSSLSLFPFFCFPEELKASAFLFLFSAFFLSFLSMAPPQASTVVAGDGVSSGGDGSGAGKWLIVQGFFVLDTDDADERATDRRATLDASVFLAELSRLFPLLPPLAGEISSSSLM